MNAMADGLWYCDLEFRGLPRIIATGVVHNADGVALIDPGPSSCLPALRRSLAARGATAGDIHTILLTHIHLDHAGATGTLVRENPRITVYVHERGAPHMADPARLLESAARLYGDAMGRLWGEFLAVPGANLRALAGGERITLGDRRLEVAYTPGHASHHVSYFDEGSRVAFVGDTAGIKRDEAGYVMPPTPPPDIDLEAWARSVARLEAWRPEALFLTHYGLYGDVSNHLQELLEHLTFASALVRESLAREESDEQRTARFAEELRRELRRHVPEAAVSGYEVAAPFEQLWMGLARYWRKRAAS